MYRAHNWAKLMNLDFEVIDSNYVRGLELAAPHPDSRDWRGDETVDMSDMTEYVDSEVFETVNGIRVPRLSPQRWEELKTFTLKPDDVFIVTYPKSGTTWTQQIVRLLRNGGREDGLLLDQSVPWLEIIGSRFSADMHYHADIDALASPRAFKGHLPYSLVPGGLPHTTPAKYIYVARNPKDTHVSLWYHVLSIHRQAGLPTVPWDTFCSEALHQSNLLYGSWFDHVLEWWEHRNEKNILFLKYEDMKKEPHKTVQAIAKFIGVEDSTGELIQEVVKKSSFSTMSRDATANKESYKGAVFSHDSKFMRKGIIGDWKNHFTAEQSAMFDAVYKEKMKDSGLEFDFGDSPVQD